MSKEVIKAVFFDQDRTILTVQSNNVYQRCSQLAEELFLLDRDFIAREFERILELNRKSSDPKKHRFLPLLKEIINMLSPKGNKLSNDDDVAAKLLINNIFGGKYNI